MSLNLESVNAKLQRAEQHTQALQDEIVPWLKMDTYAISPQINADSTRYSLIAHLVGKEPPLQRWTLMAGDSLHNMRCALDHLVYAIAVHESGTTPPPDENRLMFPITDTAAKFNESAQRTIRNVSVSVRDAIEAVQPYNRPHPKLPPPLAILRDLENIDKHRLLRLAYAAISQGNVHLNGIQSPHVQQVQFVPYGGEIKDSTEVFAIAFDAPNPNMKFETVELDMAISLWHGKRHPSDPPWHDRNEVHVLLTLLATEVRTVINTVVAAVK